MEPESPRRKLTLSTTDKYVGGVAGGLGRYFGVDPMLFRVAFGVSVVFGGIGIVAYLAFAAFLAADNGEPAWIESKGRAATIVIIVGLAVAGLTTLSPPSFFLGPGPVRDRDRHAAGRRRVPLASASRSATTRRSWWPSGVLALIGLVAALGAATGVGFIAALGGGVAVAVDLDRRRPRADHRRAARRAAMAHPSGPGARGPARRRLRRRPRSRGWRGRAHVPAGRGRPTCAPSTASASGAWKWTCGTSSPRRAAPRSTCGWASAKRGCSCPPGCARRSRATSAWARPTSPERFQEARTSPSASAAEQLVDQRRRRRRPPADRAGTATPAHEAGRVDRTLIVAGLATIALGTLLLLDRLGVDRPALRVHGAGGPGRDRRSSCSPRACRERVRSPGRRRTAAPCRPRPARTGTSAASAPGSPPARDRPAADPDRVHRRGRGRRRGDPALRHRLAADPGRGAGAALRRAPAHAPDTWLVAAGMGCLTAAGLLLLRAWDCGSSTTASSGRS